jgi:hypothetical protein
MTDEYASGEMICNEKGCFPVSNDKEFAKKVILDAGSLGISEGFAQIDFAIENYGVGISFHAFLEARDELVKTGLIEVNRKR